MKVTEETILVLNAEEREWLHRLMQNPIGGEHTESEDPLDAKMRATFWEALSR